MESEKAAILRRSFKLNVGGALKLIEEHKRNVYYKELIVWLLFLMIFFTLVFECFTVKNSFLTQQAVKNELFIGEIMNSLEQGNVNFPKLWDFLAEVEHAVCLPEDSVAFDLPESRSDSRLSTNTKVLRQLFLVGGVRVRQVRVRRQAHPSPVLSSKFEYYPRFSEHTEDREDFIVNDRRYTYSSGLSELRPLRRGTLDHVDSLGTGGYVAMLCGGNSSADGNGGESAALRRLSEDQWLDLGTRAVAVDFTLASPRTELLTVVQLLVQIEPVGLVQTELRVESLAMPTPLSDVALFPCLLCTMVAMFEVYFIAVELQQLMTVGPSLYLADLWNCWECFNIVVLAFAISRIVVLEIPAVGELTCVACAFLKYIPSMVQKTFGSIWEDASVCDFTPFSFWDDRSLNFQHLGTMRQLNGWASNARYALNAALAQLSVESGGSGQMFNAADPKTNEFLDLQGVLREVHYTRALVSGAAFLSLLQVFKYLQLNSSMYLIVRTLIIASTDLLNFCIMFLFIFVAYAVMGQLAFGTTYAAFSDFNNAMMTCFEMLVGDYDFASMQQANATVGPFFIVTFVIMVFLVLVNVFIAILSGHYESAKALTQQRLNDPLAVQYDLLALAVRWWRSLSPSLLLPGSTDAWAANGCGLGTNSTCAPALPRATKPLRLAAHQHEVHLVPTDSLNEELSRIRSRMRLRAAMVAVRFLTAFRMKALRFDNSDSDNGTSSSCKLRNWCDKDAVAATGDASNGDGGFTESENTENTDGSAMEVVRIPIRLGVNTYQGMKFLFAKGTHIDLISPSYAVDPVTFVVTGFVEENAVESASDTSGVVIRCQLASHNELGFIYGNETLALPRWSLLRFVIWWALSGAKHHLASLLTACLSSVAFLLRRCSSCFVRPTKRGATGATSCNSPLIDDGEELRRLLLEISAQDQRKLVTAEARKAKKLQRPSQQGRINDASEIGSVFQCTDDESQPCAGTAEEHARSVTLRFDQLRRHIEQFLRFRRRRQRRRANFSGFPSDDEWVMNRHIITPTLWLWRYGCRCCCLRTWRATLGSLFAPSALPSAFDIDTETLRIMRRFGGALVPLPDREARGYGYVPTPLDTNGVRLPPEVLQIAELLACNAHDVWARDRIAQGWVYGTMGEPRTHANLVSYFDLPLTERSMDLATASDALKVMLIFGWRLRRPRDESSRMRLRQLSSDTSLRSNLNAKYRSDDHEHMEGIGHSKPRYVPSPIDTSKIKLVRVA